MAFLRERLQQLAALEKQVQRLIADLDDDRFAVREKASLELESLGPEVGQALLAALADKPSAEVRRRIDSLLEKFKRPEGMPASAVSVFLAILEELGTPEARLALQELAKGPAEAHVTREAKTALDRLAKPSHAGERKGQ